MMCVLCVFVRSEEDCLKEEIWEKKKEEWPDPDLNWGHKDFQSSALPTELSGQVREKCILLDQKVKPDTVFSIHITANCNRLNQVIYGEWWNNP